MDKVRENKGTWLKVFCPEARCLSEEEVMDLPKEKREHPNVVNKKGLWLELFCPDDSCISDAEKISIHGVKAES